MSESYIDKIIIINIITVIILKMECLIILPCNYSHKQSHVKGGVEGVLQVFSSLEGIRKKRK